MRKLTKAQRHEVYKKIQKMFNEKSIHTPFLCHCVCFIRGLSYISYDSSQLVVEFPETELFFLNQEICSIHDDEDSSTYDYTLAKAIVSDLLVEMTRA